MPIYPPAHVRLQFSGTLQQNDQGGSEIFEFGWADSSGLSPEALTAAVATPMHDFFGTGASNISSFATLTGVRAETVAADGKVSGSYYRAISPVVGLSNGVMITICSQAITLETETPDNHGRMVRGRFYPPAYTGIVGSTASHGNTDNYAVTWAGLFKTLITNGAQPAVASVTAGGQIANVTDITVDSVIDTIRRRRNHVTKYRTARQSVSP